MNERATVVGDNSDQDDHLWGFFYKNGVRTDFAPGKPYISLRAVDVNDDDTAVFWGDGYSSFGTEDESYFYRDGVYRGFGDIPGLGLNIVATAINNREDVISFGNIHYRNPDGSYTTITPTMPSGYRVKEFLDINDSGTVVGLIDPIAGGLREGFVSDGSATSFLKDLLVGDTAGITGAEAYEINNEGWVRGYYRKGGKLYDALFVPVPEPGTWLALGAGLVFVSRRRTRCRQ